MSKSKNGDARNASDEGPVLFELVNPQLLPTPTLIHYLSSRCHLHQSLTSLPRDSLLNLFLSHASPKPQRTHRDNRRGKVLKRLQNKKSNKPASEANKGYKVISDTGVKRKSFGAEDSGVLCPSRLLAWCTREECNNKHLEISSKEGREVLLAGKKSLESGNAEKRKSCGEENQGGKRPKITWP